MPSHADPRQRFYRWFDLVAEPVVWLSRASVILAANRGFRQFVGDEGEGQDLGRWISESPRSLQALLDRCAESSPPIVGEFTLRAAGGRRIQCTCRGAAMEQEGLGGDGGVLLSIQPQESSGELPRHVADRAVSEHWKSEARLQLALEVGRMGIWEWDVATDQVSRSASLQTLHGLDPRAFEGDLEDHLQDIHPDDHPRVREAIRHTVERGQEYHVEYRLVCPDGKVHWMEDRGSLLYGNDGEIRAMVVVSIDTDRRKQLEEELRSRVEQLGRAESHVRSVVENVVDGIITIDATGSILTVNPAAERIFGYAAEEMRGRNVKFLMPDPYRSQHDRYLSNYLHTGQAKIIGIGREVLGLRKDGSQFPVYLGVSEFRLGGERYFTGIVRDITERKRAENIATFLADASRSLATLVDYRSTLQKLSHTAVPFFAEWCTVHVVQDDGSLRQLAAAHIDPDKSALAQELGRHCARYPDSPISPSRISKSGRPHLLPEISDSLIANVLPEKEQQRLVRDLGLRSYIGVPLTVRGKVFGVMSFFSVDPKRRYDTTDLAVAEDLAHRASTAIENALLYAELRNADRRKDEFLAMLAHELRNPLAPIRSGLDLLALNGTEPEVVGVMQQQTDHLVRLVDDLLDVSRIVRGKVDLRQESLDLRVAVQRAVDAVRPALTVFAQELAVCMPQEPVFVYADPVRLTQVITNLLTNSNRYTGRGGHIWLSVQRAGDGVTVSVKDDGIGISSELLPHVFDLFAQADRSLERSQGGLGLGLTLVRTLVEMHNGTVAAASDGVGKGSEFTVRLPVHQTAEERPATPSAARPIEGRRILIVEDNVGTARILSRLLSKLGNHHIHMVHDGLSALEAAKTFRPEIVLLDIGLPRMNGYEVAQRLRQHADFQQTVLVALTGYGTDEDRRRSAEAGFDRHLVKPPSLDNLRQVLAHPKLVYAR